MYVYMCIFKDAVAETFGISELACGPHKQSTATCVHERVHVHSRELVFCDDSTRPRNDSSCNLRVD